MPAKNNGTIRQRPDGRWEARASINGKRVSFYADRQGDALKAMRAAQKAADDGVYFEPKRVPSPRGWTHGSPSTFSHP